MMSSPGPDSQPEEMNSSQPSNASSSVPDVPSATSAPTPSPATPLLSVKVPSALNLSSTPATLKLSGSLINGHPFSDHDGDEELVIYSGNAAECPREFLIRLDLIGDKLWDPTQVTKQKKEEEEKEQPMVYSVKSRDDHWERNLHLVWVQANRSVFPWPPSTPTYDQTPPGSPAKATVDAPVEAPVESKSGWPEELRG